MLHSGIYLIYEGSLLSLILSTVTLGSHLLQVGLSLVRHTGKRGRAGIGRRQAQHLKKRPSPLLLHLAPALPIS